MTCRVCATPTIEWLDLGKQPLANALRKPSAPYPDTYPLVVARCPACGLSQLTTVLSPTTLYTGYPYRSGVSTTFRAHCKRLVEVVGGYLHPGKWLDIGANDGTLLVAAEAAGWDVVGIDPSPQHEDVWRGTFPAFGLVGPFHAITALNVLGHVDEVHAFVGEVARLLAPDGVFVVEVPYLLDLLTGIAFDTIYHEHLSYWTITSLRRLLAAHDLHIINLEYLPIHGGSVRVVAMKARASAEDDPSETQLLTPAPYERFHTRLDERIRRWWDTYTERHTWGAFGAAAKGTVFCTVVGLGPSYLRYVVDETPAKQGLITPYNVPVVPLQTLLDEPVEKLLVLPWNFEDEITEKVRAAGYEGRVETAR